MWWEDSFRVRLDRLVAGVRASDEAKLSSLHLKRIALGRSAKCMRTERLPHTLVIAIIQDHFALNYFQTVVRPVLLQVRFVCLNTIATNCVLRRRLIAESVHLGSRCVRRGRDYEGDAARGTIAKASHMALIL